ncbi:putative arylsulfatase (modular protein) [Modestobacter italicus]|uniref:Arylsulfatase (Modular protein) n=1 Tax=Modestobacter italicus (strain DSM 44449 / CECT 9708 / BC 501) TaxID=2732864 RepID=I4EYH6_MODI5|nr:sulfatase-like hydrolase/transferase [Modestobacter marinus]CCH88439.1 putative arylsulfatase (modular protein) [Modestobacter marinus]
MTADTAGAPERRPNILVLCMDQWDVHMDLPPGVDLPALQRLVGAGVTLDNQYCTVPQCTPSRATMWTGQHAKDVGLWDNTNFAWTDVLDEGIPTIGTMLREQGYYTAFKGKWHLSHPERSSEALEGYGFSDYQAWGDNWGAPLHGAQLDGTVAFETVDWLRHKRPQDKPWFLVSSMVNPHDIMFLRAGRDEQAHANGAVAALTHPAQDLGFMREYDIELPGNFSDDLDAQPFGVRSYKRNVEWNYGCIPEGREDLWKARRNYLINCLRMVDQEFRKILDELDRQDLWRDTVVVFTSDHGEMNGAHRMTQKGAIPFQEASVVNMTVVSPTGPGGVHSDAVGSHLDLATTFLSWAGLGADEIRERYPVLRGRDLRPVFEGPDRVDPPRGSTSMPGDGALVNWDGLNMLDPEWAIQGALGELAQLGDGPDKTLEDCRRAGSTYGAPDMDKRTFFRAVSDGRHKLVRWFSPTQYETPRTVEDLHATSDVALYDLVDDPGETHNIGDPSRPDYDEKLVGSMLDKLVHLIDTELGEDECPFDLDLFGTREVRYRLADVEAGAPAGAQPAEPGPATQAQRKTTS